MTITRREMMRYLIREQGMNEETVHEMDTEEMLDLYEMYHEY